MKIKKIYNKKRKNRSQQTEHRARSVSWNRKYSILWDMPARDEPIVVKNEESSWKEEKIVTK